MVTLYKSVFEVNNDVSDLLLLVANLHLGRAFRYGNIMNVNRTLRKRKRFLQIWAVFVLGQDLLITSFSSAWLQNCMREGGSLSLFIIL